MTGGIAGNQVLEDTTMGFVGHFWVDIYSFFRRTVMKRKKRKQKQPALQMYCKKCTERKRVKELLGRKARKII
jgi:hypothetical protein